MAFRDSTVMMYDGRVLISYLDKPHLYYKQERVNFDLDPTDPKAWGKKKRPKGTTTLLGDTLEKKGLQLWPMNMALGELFGYYNFTNDEGKQMQGFSHKNGNGVLVDKDGNLLGFTPEELIAHIESAQKNWTRKQKKGADVGSLVHEAIENFITGQPYEHILTVEYYERGQLFFELGTEAALLERAEWLKVAPEEIEMALRAFNAFVEWWNRTRPTVVAAEQICYSEELDYSGAFDGLLEIAPEHHPVFSDWDRPILVMEDHKTTKASASSGAPEGVYYSYFYQDAAYARAYHEMTGVWVDDMMVVSTRKDGTFSVVYLSELGVSVEEIVRAWESVVLLYRMMDKLKFQLLKHAEAAK